MLCLMFLAFFSSYQLTIGIGGHIVANKTRKILCFLL